MPTTPQLPLDLLVERSASFENYRAAAASATVDLVRAHAAGYPAAGESAHVETVMFLWGKTGAGKSHLLRSACTLAHSLDREAVCVSALDLADLTRPGELSLLCVDDVHSIAGDSQLERALFACFEELRAAGAQLLVSARQPPAAVEFELADLQSRLMWGPVLRLDPLDDDGLRMHFRAHADRFDLRLSQDVVEYVVRHCPRDAGYLEALAAALHRRSLAEKRHVSVPMVSSLVRESTG